MDSNVDLEVTSRRAGDRDKYVLHQDYGTTGNSPFWSGFGLDDRRIPADDTICQIDGDEPATAKNFIRKTEELSLVVLSDLFISRSPHLLR